MSNPTNIPEETEDIPCCDLHCSDRETHETIHGKPGEFLMD